MKKTMVSACVLMVVCLWSGGYVWSQAPAPISPGDDGGVAVVWSGCPTFIWVGVPESGSYLVSVFELEEASDPLSREEMMAPAGPVLEKEIPEGGLSWKPSTRRALCGGTYVWYVGAVNSDKSVEWSGGTVFTVDALAGLEAAGARCAGSLPGIRPDLDLESEGPASPDRDRPAPRSLEQVISSRVINGQEPDTGESVNDPGDGPGGERGITGTEGTLKTLYGFHAGVNYNTGEVDDDAGTNYWFGYHQALNQDLMIVLEYDCALQDQFATQKIPDTSDTIRLNSRNRGYLNGALRWTFAEKLSLIFHFKDLLGNQENLENFEREIRIQYVETL